jgi:Arc/MetJ-type ribon-helix-helix transcriptional regulator
MDVCLKLTGELDALVNDYIKRGKATSKAEVVRMGLNKLADEVKYEDISDDPELVKYLRDLQTGKIDPKYSKAYKNADELFDDIK